MLKETFDPLDEIAGRPEPEPEAGCLQIYDIDGLDTLGLPVHSGAFERLMARAAVSTSPS